MIEENEDFYLTINQSLHTQQRIIISDPNKVMIKIFDDQCKYT